MNKKKILITGALGHIGSHLIRKLNMPAFQRGIILMDNLESQRFPSLYGLPRNKFRFVEDDVLFADFNKYLKNTDIVVHLAASKKISAVNFQGLKRVADACLENGVKLFFPSTTSIYGSADSRLDETCDELRPQSPYAASKLKGEKYLLNLKKRGLNFVICRFGTIFGQTVGMRYDTAVNKFVWQAATDLPLTVWKTAWKQKRPYLYLGDSVRAINFILKKDLFNGEIYNVLTANLTISEVVRVTKEFIPNLKVNFVDSPIMNELSYGVSDAKFRKLGFKPLGNIQKGIAETVNALSGIITKIS